MCLILRSCYSTWHFSCIHFGKCVWVDVAIAAAVPQVWLNSLPRLAANIELAT